MAKKHAFSKKMGWIELITGPMFAGKTAELIRRLRRLSYADVKYVVFKPKIDTRSLHKIESRTGDWIESIEIEHSKEILEFLMSQNFDDSIKVIGIDEAQFFDDDLVEVCNVLSENGFNVIVSGLDLDFKAQPFGPIPKLLVHADTITKLTAVCVECGSDATRSLRKVNGAYANYQDDQINVECQEQYFAVCRHHHKVPNRPYSNENTKNFIAFCKQQRKKVTKNEESNS